MVEWERCGLLRGARRTWRWACRCCGPQLTSSSITTTQTLIAQVRYRRTALEKLLAFAATSAHDNTYNSNNTSAPQQRHELPHHHSDPNTQVRARRSALEEWLAFAGTSATAREMLRRADIHLAVLWRENATEVRVV